jgi:MMP 1-O-methyltransferase
MVYKVIKTYSEKIEGWLSEDEGKLLYDLAKNCKGNGVIVEIGSWQGKSTIWLGNGSKNGNKINVYAIDPHPDFNNVKSKNYEQFLRNIKNSKVDNLIIPIVKTSEDAIKNFDNPVELIFIDGAHEYDLVKLDFNLWFPKVIDGGTMAFHDTIDWTGPKKVVLEMVFKSHFFKDVRFIGSITYAQKVKQNTLSDRIRNRYVLLLKNLFEFKNKLMVYF